MARKSKSSAASGSVSGVSSSSSSRPPKSKSSPASEPTEQSPIDLPTLSSLSSLSSLFARLSSSPEHFCFPSSSLYSSLISRTKALYDLSRSPSNAHYFGPTALSATSSALDVLPRLLVDGFSSDQIWEQLRILNGSIMGAQEAIQIAAQKMAEKEEKEPQDDQEMEDDEDEDDLSEDAASVALEEAETAELEEALDQELAEEERLAEEEIEIKKAKKGKTEKKKVKFSDDVDEWDDEEEEEELEEEGEEDQDEEEDEEEEDQEDESASASASADGSAPLRVTNDEFFNFDEMERFADEFEDAEGDQLREDEEIDLGADIGPVNIEKAERYQDFFDPPAKKAKGKASGKAGKQQQNRDEEEESEELDEDDEWGGMLANLSKSQRERERRQEVAQFVEKEKAELEKMSTFERAQYEKSKEIAELERKIMAPREWILMGEKTARDRPQDSLLSAELEFDVATKQHDPITEAVAEQIETIVKRRILDGAWNDRVIRPALLGEKEFKYRDELSSDKPELGLADQYEMEFREAEKSASGKMSKMEEQKAKEHEEISALFAQLCHQLDSLANFHFKPKPPRLDMTVEAREEQPALSFEEATPAIGSTASAVAPEEAYKPTQRTGIDIGKGEESKEEKKRKRLRHKEQYKKQKLAESADAQRNAAWKSLTEGSDQPRDQFAGGHGKDYNRIGGRKKISAQEIASATSARNVKRAAESDSKQYNKSTEFFALLNQVEKDAKREAKQQEKQKK